jgi:hypothetical protein
MSDRADASRPSAARSMARSPKRYGSAFGKGRWKDRDEDVVAAAAMWCKANS